VSLKELERQAIDKALTRHRGNIAAAARFLGVSRGTLYRRLKGKA
jgi:transcriptional regulator of acetoin/glycerol metabolism